MSDNDILREAKSAFTRADDSERENRKAARDDIDFARLSKQWPDQIQKQREQEMRPCLTINKVAPVIRQVVNDSRQNRPAITVKPVDSNADPETAEVITGLIRNIEQVSDADIAYDTAIDNAVSGGFGYWRVNLAYANDIDIEGDLSTMGAELFEKDIVIERIANAFSVYGDPDSQKADSSDWNVAFVIDEMKPADFKRKYPDARGDFDAWAVDSDWCSDDKVRVAEYWKREKTEKTVVAVEDMEGEVQILALDDFKARQVEIEQSGGKLIAGPRSIPGYKVTQYIMTGVEILETNEWPGQYIPIIPVYGDEVWAHGKRYLRSLIRDAKDANRMFNYWRTAATELVALAPKAPWVGEQGFTDADPEKWEMANTASFAYLEYKKGANPPQRQPFAGIPAGALQEALNASDDIKATTGIYDASLGAPSNETSGRAITARQREGDVSTFHFIDNLSRSIRHCGRVILDMIPKVYTTARIVRVLGEDGDAEAQPVNQPVPQMDENGQPMVDEQGQAIQRIYDLRIGRYDLAVTSGPSFTTRREEAASQMIELVRSFPDAAPVIGDLLAKNLDWPGADEIAKRLEKLVPGNGDKQSQQQIQQLTAKIQELMQKLNDKSADHAVDAAKVSTDQYKAETDRMQALQPAMGPQEIQALVIQTITDLFNSPAGGQQTGLPNGQPALDANMGYQ